MPITTVTWSSMLPAEALSHAITALDSPETRPMVLWDFSAVQHVTINRGQVQVLAKTLREQSSRRRPNGKTAVVVPSDLLFGLARQAHTFALLLSTNPPIEIFRDRAAALTWFRTPRPTGA